MRGEGRTDAGLIGIFPFADPLPLDEKRSGTKLAWGSRQRRLPRLGHTPLRKSPDELATSGGAASGAAGGWIVLVSDRWKTPALNELEAAFYAANQRI